MPILENTLEKYVIKKAKEKNFLVFKLNNPASDGYPDRLFVTPTGIHFYIEFKRRGKNLRPLQAYRFKQLEDHKCHVYMIDNKEDGTDVLEHYERMASAPLPGKKCRTHGKTVSFWTPSRSRSRED